MAGGLKKSLSKLNEAARIEKALTQALNEIVSPERMKKYAEFAAEMIKLRTKLGSGVERAGKEKQRLKPLKPSTIEERKRLQAKGKLSGLTTPGKSNLTRTGQLLDSTKPTDVSRGHAIIGPTGVRDDGKKNEDVGAYVTYAGRPYNDLSRVELKRLNDSLKRDLRAAVRKHLTKAK